ncbi:MAG: twin-arginine translocase subunit TatC [Dehalococcoidia bacterium]|nr:twin-arginine translocase subunit TatC [Dehalococcoidia bacterium]MXY88273.1 twin-arginine translocase subunit TatC [Dehalococcoidia bacterium]MXZ87661.1 twin-arginine translocase subunit TatC [Dehalococcoidia bacterium]MYA52838.1 twin-arginine translocase subunit TatC [Dehalococcoidia bacterium]MYI85692.1 twin-arginine translocase subunit TatC [Dehalococcoidia bacterium]
MVTDTTVVNPQEGPEELIGPQEESDLTIMEHLIELRNRFMVAAAALILGVIVVLFFTWDPPDSWPNTFDILLDPARDRIDVNLGLVQDEFALLVHEQSPDGRYIPPETELRGPRPEGLALNDLQISRALENALTKASGGLSTPDVGPDDVRRMETVQDAFDYLGGKSEENFRLASFSPTDRISAIFKISVYGGLLLALPIIIYEVLAFIVPGLTRGERRVLLMGTSGCMFFMLAGMAFAYYIVLPRALDFLLNVAAENVVSVTGVHEYISFVTRIILWVGIAYQLPMVLAIAARVGLVTAGQLLRFWRYAIVIVFILAAIATPTPDPVTQSVVAIPLLGLYFLGVLFAKILYTPRDPDAEALA